jgi:hypothetical protein
MVQLTDGARGAALGAISRTLYLALDRRDAAIKDIRTLAPPSPDAEEASVHARASGGQPVANGFDTVMPQVTGQLDDELQAIDATRSDAGDLSGGGRRVLNTTEPQVRRTRQTVSATWPLIPPEA